MRGCNLRQRAAMALHGFAPRFSLQQVGQREDADSSRIIRQERATVDSERIQISSHRDGGSRVHSTYKNALLANSI